MTSRRARRVGVAMVLVLATTVAASVGGSPPAGAFNEAVAARVSAKADGTGLDGGSFFPFTTGDGRWQGFLSDASDLVPGVTTRLIRVYLRDRLTGRVDLISRRSDGTPATQSSAGGAVTPDGRFVAFSTLDALVPSDDNAVGDTYVRDRRTGNVELVSVSSAEVLGNGASGGPFGDSAVDISDDGRYVVFTSAADNLVPSDVNGLRDVFRRDRQSGVTTLVSVNGAVRSNGTSGDATMSADGRYVAFSTGATNLITNDTNGWTDVARRDMNGLGLDRVSVGGVVNPNSASFDPSISADGTRVAFTSAASDLVANDTNGRTDIFLRTLGASSSTVRVSVTSGGAQVASASTDPSIRPDGSGVAYLTRVPQSDPEDEVTAVYLREGGTTTLVSAGPGGTPPAATSVGPAASNDDVLWHSGFRYAPLDTDNRVDVYAATSLFYGPHPTLSSFVARQLVGFTGSAPSATVTQTVNRIRSGLPIQAWVLGLARGEAFSRNRAPVTRLYWAYFERRPDEAGLDYWLAQRASGSSLNAISQKFSQSPEFTTLYGNTTNTQFVTLVYQNVLDRQPDAGGLAYWVGRLGGGLRRGDLMVLFSESPEGRGFMAPYVDPILLGLGMYASVPSKPLFDGMVDAVVGDGYPTEIGVDYVLGAPEYAAALP